MGDFNIDKLLEDIEEIKNRVKNTPKELSKFGRLMASDYDDWLNEDTKAWEEYEDKMKRGIPAEEPTLEAGIQPDDIMLAASVARGLGKGAIKSAFSKAGKYTKGTVRGIKRLLHKSRDFADEAMPTGFIKDPTFAVRNPEAIKKLGNQLKNQKGSVRSMFKKAKDSGDDEDFKYFGEMMDRYMEARRHFADIGGDVSKLKFKK